MNNYRVVQYGCGKMSTYIMRCILEKGMSIVGAVDINKNVICMDISTIIGYEELGVNVTDAKNIETLLKKVNPDIVAIKTMSLMKDIEDIFMICARLGINAISTCEEALYPFNSSPKLTKKK